MVQERMTDEKKSNVRKPETMRATDKRHADGSGAETPALIRLQRQAGNRAVQRLLQRQGGDQGFDLDDETAGRINRARGGGQSLDGGVQEQMGAQMGYDFGGVRVHTGRESDELNQQLSARAFTTGQDIFVRSGDYSPTSSGGRELIAHELSHVVQQGTGRVPGGGSGMTVRPAGDAFEQESDALARQAVHAGHQAAPPAAGGEAAQRQPEDEEEEEPLQEMPLQRQDEIPEEEV